MKTKKSICLLALTITLATSITTQGQNLKVSPDPTFASKDEEKSIAVKSAIITTECSGTSEANSTTKKWAVKVRSNIIKHPEFEEVQQIKNQKLPLKLQAMKNQTQSQESFSTAAVTPVIGTNFEANWMVNGTPPDNSMAISNGGYIVTANNDGVEYYNQSGSFLYFDFWSDFFNDPLLTASLYDPKVLYDSGSDRFIMVVLHGSTASTSKVIVCFSKTNNPQNGWWTYKLTGNPLNDNSWFDYPSIGVSNNEFYVTGNLFYTGSGFNQAVIYQIQKSAGFSGGSLSWQYWSNINSTPFTAATIVPVSNGHQGNYGPGIYLVSTKAAGDNKIRLYDLTDDMTASNEQLNHYTINTTSYSPSPNSSQLGNSDLLDNGDCRIQNGFYLNGIIHFVFHSDIGSGWNGINYNRLTVSNTTNQSSTFGLSGSFDYSYPSVVPFSTVNTDKSVMVCFLRASSSIYPEVRVVNCDDNLNWSSSTLVKSGETYVNIVTGEERWGDYTGISRKHNSSTSKIWLAGCYGANIPSQSVNNTYKTWVAEVYANSNVSVEENFSVVDKTVVFPNPVYDFFSIKFTVDNSEETVITVYDQQGKLVRTLFKDAVKKGENIFSFNKNALSNGTYFLVITNNQKNIANEKIIILN